MKKRACLLFAILFFTICLIPSVGMLVFGKSEAAANEVLSLPPKLTDKDGRFNSDFFGDLSDYFGDHFALRQEFITLWAKLNAKLLHTSVTDTVTLGRNGWLYYSPTMEDFTGSNPMTEREIFCAERTLSLLNEYAEGRESRFLFVICPNKASLYPDYLCGYTKSETVSNASRLMEALEADGIPHLDLFSVFKAQDETLYFETDSHWNARGAALGADSILTALDIPSGYFAQTFSPSEHLGDLYEMLYPAGRETEADFELAETFHFGYTSKSSDADAIKLTTECENGSGNLLMYRDSFGRNLYPYLAERFQTAEFSRKNDYSPLALTEGSYLVVELVERNLRYLNDYSPTLPAPAREMDLSSAEAAGNISLTAARCEIDGYVKIAGNFDDLLIDDTSIVYISADGTVWEATPTPAGFSACIPGTEGELDGISVYVTSNTRLLRLDSANS